MKLTYEGFSETGMVRSGNQDVFGIYGDGAAGLFLVADGMGGHSQGERASKELKDACTRWWDEQQERIRLRRRYEPGRGGFPELPEVLGSLKEMLTLASRKIWEDTEPDSVCGAAYVLLWIWGPAYALVWTGDCRCYRAEQSMWRQRILQLTTDDCWENQPDSIAGLSESAVRNHPNYGKLVRAAGAEKNLVCTVQTGTVKGRTLFALCSDGVYKYAGEKAVEACMSHGLKTGNIGGALENLRLQVYRRGAPDNLTCILVRAEE